MALALRTKSSCTGRTMYSGTYLSDTGNRWPHYTRIISGIPYRFSKGHIASQARKLTKRLLKDHQLLLLLCALLFFEVLLGRKDAFLAQDVIPLRVFVWVLQRNKKQMACVQEAL